MNQEQKEYVNWMNSLLSDSPKRQLLVDFLHWLDEKHVTLCITANPGTDGDHSFIQDNRTPEQFVTQFLASR